MALGADRILVCDGTIRAILARFLPPWKANRTISRRRGKVYRTNATHFQTRPRGWLGRGLVGGSSRLLTEAREHRQPVGHVAIGGNRRFLRRRTRTAFSSEVDQAVLKRVEASTPAFAPPRPHTLRAPFRSHKRWRFFFTWANQLLRMRGAVARSASPSGCFGGEFWSAFEPLGVNSIDLIPMTASNARLVGRTGPCFGGKAGPCLVAVLIVNTSRQFDQRAHDGVVHRFGPVRLGLYELKFPRVGPNAGRCWLANSLTSHG